MKKIIGIAAVAAMVAASAFADGITFSSWNRSGIRLFSQNDTKVDATYDGTSLPGYPTETHSYLVIPTPDFASGSRVGLQANGSTENMGFQLEIYSNGSTLGTGDTAFIWGKVGMFKFDFGRIHCDTLRGASSDFGDEDIGTVAAEDDVFTRFQPTIGSVVEITPMDGLFIGAAIDGKAKAGTNAADAYYDMQYGAGYTIPDTAQIRVQYIGSSRAFQAAVKLLMLKGNTIDIGATLPVVDKDTNAGYDAKVAAYFGGSTDKLAYGVHAVGQFGLSKYTVGSTDYNNLTATTTTEDQTLTVKSGSVYGIDGRISYDLGIVKVGATALFKYTTIGIETLTRDITIMNMGGTVFVEKPLTGGYLFAGIGDSAALWNAVNQNDSKDKASYTTNTFDVRVGAQFSL